ncbi:MAG TPA: L-ribulose-5-phosphate 4-epimerase AraD, partial [Tepidisphaeraceae bacterium]|nr:L-ribulose-5-phosphate 4-epimerase AraD [Tepidisphaeraceae bacterium]
TWGNVSGVDRATGVMAIKPSGIAYEKLSPADMVIVSLKSGDVIEGAYRPSSDTLTHLHLYRSFKNIGGIAHAHCTYGTSFSQALREIPCLGTTHADTFYGAIPVTRSLSNNEIEADYELNTGRVIVECFCQRHLDPAKTPGVLVASHAPFTWGPTPEKAVENAIVLEFSAKLARHTLDLSPKTQPILQGLLNRHFLRKHGPRAYYGQHEKHAI